MVFDECHFEFGNFISKKYGLIFAHVDTESIQSRMTGDIESLTIFNRGSKSRYLVGNDYESSAITMEAEIVTDDCLPLSADDKRIVEKSLFNKPEYRRLYIDIDDDYLGSSYEVVDGILKRSYLNCRFVNPQKIEQSNGQVIGYRFTIECDSALLWQDAIVALCNLNHNSATSNSIISILVDTDLNEYVYPKVSIKIGSVGGDITISNNSDEASRLTSFRGLTPNITLVMKGGGINYISGDNYLKFSNKNFIRLLDGENLLTVIGDVTEMTFEFQNRRFL